MLASMSSKTSFERVRMAVGLFAPMRQVMSFGFVVTRCVRSREHDLLWRHCVRCVRECYPSVPIVVLDDHSDGYCVSTCDDPNVTIVASDRRPGCAELLPYLYLRTSRRFDKAVVLHDSVFLHRPFAPGVVEDVATVRYLWSFEEHEPYYRTGTERMLACLGIDPDEYVRKEWQGFGCFGTMSIMTLAFLDRLFERYPLENLEPLLHTRLDRMCLERAFAIACFLALEKRVAPSVHGDIVQYMPYNTTYGQYVDRNAYWRSTYPIVKVWNGR